jgi:hypothetical protein
MRYCLGPPSAYANLWAALAFMPFGLFFDFMDGKVARWRKKSSLMGQELDSLADLVYHLLCKFSGNASSNKLNRSLSVSPPLQQPSPLAFAPRLTTSSSHSLFCVGSLALHASISPLQTYRKMLPERVNTLKALQFRPLCRLQHWWHIGLAKVGFWMIYQWELGLQGLYLSSILW